MQLLKKPIEISEKTTQEFTVNKSAYYLISISAKVKSEKQRNKNATDDEDLRVEIDGRKFPKLNNQQRYFDSPAAFSGGKLHNNKTMREGLISKETYCGENRQIRY